MRALFVDTGAWVALRYRRDQYHERASDLLRRALEERRKLVTTESVLGETVTLLKARGAVEQALALGEALRSGAVGRLIYPGPRQRRRGWELFCRYRSQRFGYVNCTSFAVMESLALRIAFTFDEDFRAAGFELYG